MDTVNKPEWASAPEWANWLSQDPDGGWYWFENRPRKSINVWMPDGGMYDKAGNTDQNLQWVDTLECKPSIDESQKPTPLKSWFDAGELPAAGTECEYTIGDNFGGYKQCCFVGFNSRGSLVIELLDGNLKCFHKHQIKFRPLKTDRDKFIDAAANIIDRSKLCTSEQIAGDLFDAGFKAPE